MQILPDIYLLDGFAYANHPNFYLVVGPEGNVIVDAGTLPEELERADARAETWGISLDQGGEDCDKPTYITSLKKLAAMEVDCILAGHYLPYLEQGKRLVGRAYVKALCEWR